MEFNLHFFPDQGYVEVNASGHITVDSVVDVLGAILSHEYWKPGMHIFADYLDSSTIDLNSERIIQISHLVREQKDILGSGKMAIVMSSDLDFGFARMFQLLTEDYISKEINVYRDRTAAYQWLAG